MEVKNIPSNSGLNWYLRYLHSINFSAPKCAKNGLLHQLLVFAHSCLAKIYGARNINRIKVFHYERSKCSWWQVEIFIMTGQDLIMNDRDFHDYSRSFTLNGRDFHDGSLRIFISSLALLKETRMRDFIFLFLVLMKRVRR